MVMGWAVLCCAVRCCAVKKEKRAYKIFIASRAKLGLPAGLPQTTPFGPVVCSAVLSCFRGTAAPIYRRLSGGLQPSSTTSRHTYIHTYTHTHTRVHHDSSYQLTPSRPRLQLLAPSTGGAAIWTQPSSASSLRNTRPASICCHSRPAPVAPQPAVADHPSISTPRAVPLSRLFCSVLFSCSPARPSLNAHRAGRHRNLQPSISISTISTISTINQPQPYIVPPFAGYSRTSLPGFTNTLPAHSTTTAKINSSTATSAGGAPLPPDSSYSAPPPLSRLPALHAHAHLPQPPQLPSPSARASPLISQASPSTVQASPLPTPTLSVATINGSAEAHGQRPDPARMRSAIACLKCRRSKVRCENNGHGTPCKNCVQAGRPCDYSTSSPSSTANSSHRRESVIASHDHPGVETSSRKRKKTLAPSSGVLGRFKDASISAEDALDSPSLTPKVWRDLFDIFEKHFATDFPFLHRKTFLESLQQANPRSPAGPSFQVKSETPISVRPPHSPQLLLAFLTLTARFHTELVRPHANPRATAEYYAELARKHLGPDVLKEPTMENTQALLMLGFHDWGNLQGARAWITIGTAIRCAQALGYHCDPELDDMQEAVPHPVCSANTQSLSEKDRFLLQEKERRTLWSCFLMDRYLSSGKYRLHMLNTKDLRQQLPCSDAAFNHGRRVRTRMLHEDDAAYAERRKDSAKSYNCNGGNDANDANGTNASMYPDNVKWEVDEQEGMLSRYIQVMEIYGDIMSWTCAGGRRRQAKVPPWVKGSSFWELEDRLKRLKRSLPRDLQLNLSNTADHIHDHTSRNFVLLHAVITLCTIALYREYMAFLPFKVEKPQGPLDEPKFEQPPPDDKPDYWVDQARECFKAAKEFSDLVQECRRWDLLVETPISGFTAYTVAFCDVYCFFFPRMDPDGYLNHERDQPDAGHVSMDVIIHMRERLEMPWKWRSLLINLHHFIRRMRKEFKELGDSPGSTTSSTDSQHRSLRDGGGGLFEYLSFERDHKELGDIKKDYTEKDLDEIRHNQDLEDLSEGASPAAAFTNVEKSEHDQSRSPVPSQFQAVNAVNNVNTAEVTPKPDPANGQYVLNGHTNGYGPHSSAGQQQSHTPVGQQQPHAQPQPVAAHGAYQPIYASGMQPYPLPPESTQRDSSQLHQVQQGQAAETGAVHGPDQFENWDSLSQKEQNIITYGQLPIQAFDLVDFAHGQPQSYGDPVNNHFPNAYSSISVTGWLSVIQPEPTYSTFPN